MKFTSQNKNKQLSLDLFKSSFDDLDRSNRWVLLGDMLPWAEIEKIYNSRLSNEFRGAGNKPARMIIGAMIIKHKLNLSDEETILIIRENPYMQYLCGLTELTDKQIFDPSLFVTIRKRISEEEINKMTSELINEALRKRQEATEKKNDDNNISASSTVNEKVDDKFASEYTDDKGEMHKGVLKIDATCANAEVRYPVDIDIIHDGCKVVDRYIKKLCTILGIRTLRSFYQDARYVYLKVVKRKKKFGKFVKKSIRFMLNCLNKGLKTIVEIFVNHTGSKEQLAMHEQNILQATFDMFNQQCSMLNSGSHTCSHRIISIYQPHIRPIIRGKAKSKVEFGAKIGVSLYNGYIFIDRHSWEAYNESVDLKLHIELYKRRFGYLPATLLADKIYMNKANRKLLKQLQINTYSKPLGRPPKQEQTSEYYQDMVKAISDRNEIECSFGTGKRIYRADNIRAKLPQTAKCWTGMCYFIKNVMKFLRELCLVFFRTDFIWSLISCYCKDFSIRKIGVQVV